MRGIRILSLVAATLLLGAGGGGLWLWMSKNPGNEPGEDLDESDDLDFDYTQACSQLASAKRNMDSYWDCLEDNAFYLTSSSKSTPVKAKREIKEENAFSQSGNWKVRQAPQQFKAPVPYKGNKPMKKSGRRKRSIEEKFPGRTYTPVHTNWILRSKPYSTRNDLDRPPYTYNDYYFNGYSDFLYTYDQSKLNQKQPPWSYDGESNQKNWHKLDLEKFFVPVIPELGTDLTKLLHASFRDHWSETNWTSDRNFTEFFEPYLQEIFKNKTVPDFIAKLHTHPIDKLLSLLNNTNAQKITNPNVGYYSDSRFLFPPPQSTKELEDLKKQGALPLDLEIPGSYEDLQSIQASRHHWFNLVYNWTTIRPGHPDHDYLNNEIVLWFRRGLKYFQSRQFDTTDWGFLHIDEYMKYFLHESEKERIKLLQDRSQLSLPLLPHPYPICQQQEPSPIDILEEFSSISSIRPYEFDKNFYKIYKARMSFPADGTNILAVTLEDSDRLFGRAIGLTGGATTGVKLYFEAMFVHIGTTETTGTEHKLQGKGYAMELQLLFTYRGKDRDESQPYYKTLARQQNDLFPFRGKVALMLALLVEVKPDDEVRDKLLFEPLTQLAYKFHEQELKNPGGLNRSRAFTTDDYVMRLSDYIPSDAQFYTYRGGLTFPPCFGYIYWSVYNQTLHITRAQFHQFQFLPGRGDSEYLAGNVRDIESEWVEAENVPGIPPAAKQKLREARTRRTLLKSLDPKLYGVKGNESHYDYYYDYDKASSPYISKILIALLPTTLITLFYI